MRAGRSGERDEEALREGLAIVGWDDVPDLSEFETKNHLRSYLLHVYQNRTPYVVGNWTGQLWRFSHEMGAGDLVVMPLKSTSQVAIGEVVGPYRYRTDAKPGFRHVQPVRWLRTDVDPAEFDPDLRSSMGSLLTVCQLTRHEAPQRIEAIAGKRPDPGWRHKSASVDPDTTLDELWEAVATGSEPVRLTVRELLAKWDFTRRTATSLAVIQTDLAEQGVATRPPLTSARMDSVVELVTVAAEPDSGTETAHDPNSSADTDEPEDLPVKWSVSAVAPTDRKVQTVVNGSSLSVAITRMLATGYSQLAVVDDQGHYQGAVSWESIGRAQLATPDATLRDATVHARVVNHDDDLFTQIEEIYQRGFVFVIGEDRKTLEGIVTAHDLTRQFGALAQPFSLVEEAELRLRRQVKRTVPEELIRPHTQRWSHGVPTFGKYVHLLKDPATFELLGWSLDHATFLELLERVVAIRNELMHFSQDRLPTSDLHTVDGFVAMLRTVDRQV